MWDYISGLLFLIWIIALSYLFGFSIRKEHNFSTNLITGYIGYSFIIGLGLMVIELFDVPWMFALIYFFLTIIFILFYIIYSIKKNKLKITKEDGKWVQVKSGKSNGWVLKSQVNLAETNTVNNSVVLAKYPSITAKGIKTIDKGTPIKIIKTNGLWSKVSYENVKGWIPVYYIK